ncbi:MAG: hypothetical protein M0Z59_08900 [Nitrospiraceae bacterium]|nr:hypothetical protein [Nitrospiraceae bacterium]
MTLKKKLTACIPAVCAMFFASVALAEDPVYLPPVKPIQTEPLQAAPARKAAPQKQAAPAPASVQPVSTDKTLSSTPGISNQSGVLEPAVRVEEVNPQMDIRVSGGRVSAELKNAPLGKAIMELGKKAGFKADISSAVAGIQVSTRFKGLPVEDALRRILSLAGDTNYILSYGEDDSISGINIYESHGRPAAAQPPQSVPPMRFYRAQQPANNTVGGQPVYIPPVPGR